MLVYYIMKACLPKCMVDIAKQGGLVQTLAHHRPGALALRGALQHGCARSIGVGIKVRIQWTCGNRCDT